MSESRSPGARLRRAVAQERPLQVVGAINAYAARLAEASGFQALYVSGGGVAAGSYGVPDLGITRLDDVLEDVRRITDVTMLPLLVDIDTGWGGAFNIARTVRRCSAPGPPACTSRTRSQPSAAATGPARPSSPSRRDGGPDQGRGGRPQRRRFVIMARTDALAVEGMEAAIERACACVEAGADMIFPEAMTELAQYRRFVDAVKVPVLANITEFGATPLFTTEELRGVGVGLVLYPLSAFRAMNKAALNVYQAIRRDGTQRDVRRPCMQTREELIRLSGLPRLRAETGCVCLPERRN